MTPGQAGLIEDFWAKVRKSEALIHESGHRSCPVDAGDRRDVELEDAYDALHPLLVCLSSPQVFVAVSSLSNRRGPFTAENAHQALTFVLNPPEALFGDPSHLATEHYVSIRMQAEREAAKLATMEQIPVAVPVLPRVGAEVWQDSFSLRWELPREQAEQTVVEPLSYRMSRTMEKLFNALDQTPRTADELAVLVECEHQTARKYLLRLMEMGLAQHVAQGYIRKR